MKSAIAGEDPNWGRIVMAIGKASVPINIEKLSIKFGNFYIIQLSEIRKKINLSV